MKQGFQVRYDEETGTYRDCKWCGGKGCLACPSERDKEYNRQFPDGPKPIFTITREELERADVEEAMGLPGIENTHGPFGKLVQMADDLMRENRDSSSGH